MEYLNELVENMNFDYNSYFYYIVEKGNSEEIFEQGIAMEDEKFLSSNFLSLENMDDPLKFCKKQLKKRILKEKEMIIVECVKGEENKLILKNYEPVWNAEKQIKYIIMPENVMCYIDLDSLKVVYNLEYHYSEYPRGV